MYISRKTQIFITDFQKEIIDTMIYVRRNIWNKLVEVYNPIIIDKLNNKQKNVLPAQTELTKYVKSLDFPLVHNRVYVACVVDYLEAWKMCFKIKERRKPHFHSITSEQRVNLCSMEAIKIINGTFVLSTKKGGKIKDKTIKLAEELKEFEGINIPNLSFIRRNNKYYVSLVFIIELDKKQSQNNQIGCDWGLKEFLTYSNKEVYNLPKSLVRQEIRIKNLQRKLSLKCKGSKNREKLRIKLNVAWQRYINIRKDFIDKLSYKLLSNSNLICLEDLDIQEMIDKSHKNRRKNIYKNCFNIFKVRLVQKSERFYSEVIFADKYFPSSQLCSSCGARHSEMKDLRRTFKCDCGLEIDRDLNASINILREGLRTKLVG